jgi:hypothetical protein
MDGDGQFDYRKLTKAQIEYAIIHIDGSKFPANLANARAALEARNSGASPEPAPLLDAATDARYTYWVERSIGILIGAYAMLGIAFDNVVIPYWRRRRGEFGFLQLHGHTAWIAAAALMLLAAIPFFNGIEDSEKLAIKPRFKYVLFVAIVLMLVAFLVAPKIDRLTLQSVPGT